MRTVKNLQKTRRAFIALRLMAHMTIWLDGEREKDRVAETGSDERADDAAVPFLDPENKIPSKTRETLREVFALFDIGGEGATLTNDEMKQCVKLLPCVLAPILFRLCSSFGAVLVSVFRYLTKANPELSSDTEGLARIMAHMDDDKSGEVEFSEFLDWVAEMESAFAEREEEVFRTMFSMIDEDGGGTITLNELCTKMKHLGEEFNPDDVQEILMEVDKDGSGHLDGEEFAVLVNKVLKPETEQFNA